MSRSAIIFVALALAGLAAAPAASAQRENQIEGAFVPPQGP